MVPGGAVGVFSHVNALYRSPAELAQRTAREATSGVEAGEAVLISLPEQHWPAIRHHLSGSVRDSPALHFLSAATRYDHPVQAMGMLWDFVHGHLSAGATGVRSIGSIDYRGDATDGAWLRYEAAVNDVFAQVPLRAVCLTDAAAPAEVVRPLAQVHPAWDDGDGEADCPSYDPEAVCRHLPPAVTPPSDPPDLDLLEATASAARRQVSAVVADTVGEASVEGLSLVVTELLVNANRHGGGGSRLRLWCRHDAITVAVTDAGPGIGDPYYGLRPTGLTAGGRGLWLVSSLTDALASSTSPAGHTVTARLPVGSSASAA